MKWIARAKFNKAAKVAGIITLILAVSMAVFTFFGANGGNFVVNLKPNNDISIMLYDNVEMIRPSTRLSYPSVLDQRDYTYEWLPENIEDGIGDKSDHYYRGYTALSFILRNESTVPVDIRASIELSRIVKGVDSAVRLMMIVDGDKKIFAKLSENLNDNGLPAPEMYPEGVIPFISPAIVCEETYYKIPMNGEKKFTVVIWLEGEDAQCNDTIKGGSMRLFMNISVV